MTIKCDVLVVGGGPAGGVASLTLAKNGIDVILLEKNAEIGGHTNTKIDVTPQDLTDKIVKELDLKHNGIGKKSIWYSPNGQQYAMESEVGEYYFKRGSDSDSFENQTVASAIKNGCNLVNNKKINNIEKENSLFIISLNDGNKIKAKYLIGSDGSDSFVRKKFISNQKGKELVAYGISSYDFDTEHSNSRIYFNADMLPGGYIYLVKDKNGLSSAGIVLNPLKISNQPKKIFEKYKEKNSEFGKRINGKIISEFGGKGCVGGIKQIRLEKLLFVGDAGWLASPLFGYGMKPAIISGYLAAVAINDTINNDPNKINNYDSDCKEKLKIKLSTKMANSWDKLGNNDINILFQILNKIYERNGNLSFLEKLKIFNLIRRTGKYNELKFILKSFEEMA